MKLTERLLCFVLFSGAACAAEKPPPPPPTVLVAPVTRGDLALFIEAVGTLDGYVNADIRARVKGYLRQHGRGRQRRAGACECRESQWPSELGAKSGAR
jgi:hypothetical protein